MVDSDNDSDSDFRKVALPVEATGDCSVSQ